MAYASRRSSFLIRAASLAGLVALTSTLGAHTPNWFPLEIGNTWLYHPASADKPPSLKSWAISVHGKKTVAGREYFQVSYFGREVLLREGPSDGSLVLYDRASRSEQPWLSLGLPAGSTFSTSINPCPTTGTIVSRDESVTIPVGTGAAGEHMVVAGYHEFKNVVRVQFHGSCADVGTTQQLYAPNVGLLSTEETTFVGPLKFDLFYYRIGSSTGAAEEVSFTVGLDSPRYAEGSTMHIRLTLRSSSLEAIHLHFLTGQSFNLRIYDENGKVVDVWSKDKIFPLMIRDEIFGPGEKTYGVMMPLKGFPPGRYTAEGYLTTEPLLYLGRVSFEIVPVQR